MKILRIFMVCLLAWAAAPALPAADEAFRRAEGAERIMYNRREYFNYKLLLRGAGPPSLPGINLNDIVLEPQSENSLTLHSDLLERMYRENMTRVFFIVELSPYFPPRRYDRVPWGTNQNYTLFGNAFWRDPGSIRDIYRRVYGTAAEDFNSHMRRVERHRQLEESPKVFVFARLRRTGANSQWRNAWGWDYYYYFDGETVYMP